MRPNWYRLRVMWRYGLDAPKYTDGIVDVLAYSAEDAIVQVKTTHASFLEFRVLDVAPFAWEPLREPT